MPYLAGTVTDAIMGRAVLNISKKGTCFIMYTVVIKKRRDAYDILHINIAYTDSAHNVHT